MIREPDGGSSEGSARLFLVEQLDNKGSVNGGSASIVARLIEKTDIHRTNSLESAPGLVQRIPASMPFRPYGTRADIALNFDGIFVAYDGSQYIGVEPRNDGSDVLTDIEVYMRMLPIPTSLSLHL